MDFPFIRPNNPRFVAQVFLISLPILYFLKDIGFEKYIICLVASFIVEFLVGKLFPNYVKYFDRFKKRK